ncbi:MAG: hypothetical protein K0R17_1063 [Rariglobus sp.]|jgi:hypothetical protein|nr:hypothetical protein [Rariglobus sp.]
MIPLLRPFLLVSTVVFAPLATIAQTSPAAPAATQPALSTAQMNEGLKTGLNFIVTQALVPGSIKVPPSPSLAKAGESLKKLNKEGVYEPFNRAFADTVAKVTPKAFELIKNALKDVKIEDAKTVLAGGPDAGTKFLQKAIGSSVNDALLPIVRQSITATGLTVKGREVFDEIEPQGVKGSARAISDFDYYICKQVIAQSFKLIAAQEAAVRANPALMKTNALAQKVFTEFKK